MSKPLIISVVRDREMYDKCITQNSFCNSCDKLMLDNRTENLRIPTRYNQALTPSTLSTPRWLVFCHEDFQPLEDVYALVENLNQEVIYGPIGAKLLPRKRWLLGGLWTMTMVGQIIESNKDGSSKSPTGVAASSGTIVDTLDCSCLIVHSSLFKKHGLSFDENLSFDLYVEDFCTYASFVHNIPAQVVKFNCHHYSKGVFLPRLLEQKAYLDKKYPKTEKATLCTYSIGGGQTTLRRIQKRCRSYLDHHSPWLVKLIFRII